MRKVVPDRRSAAYHDFEAVNGILAVVEPTALQTLATGRAGLIAHDVGSIGPVPATWSAQTARAGAVSSA